MIITFYGIITAEMGFHHLISQRRHDYSRGGACVSQRGGAFGSTEGRGVRLPGAGSLVWEVLKFQRVTAALHTDHTQILVVEELGNDRSRARRHFNGCKPRRGPPADLQQLRG